jgi:hypothetical protein
MPAQYGRIGAAQLVGDLRQQRTGEAVVRHGAEIAVAVGLAPDGRAPAETPQLGQRFLAQQIVDHGDLRTAIPPARRDLARGGIRIDRVPADPATVLEVEAREDAGVVGIGVAAAQIILLLAVVLHLVRRDRLAAAGGARRSPESQLGVMRERREAFRQLVAFAQDRAEILVRQDHLRLEGDRAPIAVRRFVQPALQPQHVAEIAMRQGIIGLHGEHPPECRRGLVQPALILQREAEIVADAGVIGPGLQDAAVKALRLGQSPGALVGKSLLQRGFECRGLRGDHGHGNCDSVLAQLYG